MFYLQLYYKVEATDIIASINALSTTRNAWRLQESHKQHSYGMWLSLLPTLLSTPFVNYVSRSYTRGHSNKSLWSGLITV